MDSGVHQGVSRFREFIGIDYSGAQSPDDPLGNLKAFRVPRVGPASEHKSQLPRRLNLSRREVRSWVLAQLQKCDAVLIGIDHGFSLPSARLMEFGVRTWADLLDRFRTVVQTQLRSVADARSDATCAGLLAPPQGEAFVDWFRLTERRASGVRSVFAYEGPGVAFSTMAGIAELAVLRDELRAHGVRAHFWPFDGMAIPESGPVIVEVYPALCNRQFERDPDESLDQHDARCVALWLREISVDGRLRSYLNPSLSAEQRALVDLEGWILGVM